MAAVDIRELTGPIMGRRPEQAPPAFHLLAKPTGAICNLDCAYCFFLDKEAFYPGSKFRMSEPVLEQYIRQLIESPPQIRIFHRCLRRCPPAVFFPCPDPLRNTLPQILRIRRQRYVARTLQRTKPLDRGKKLHPIVGRSAISTGQFFARLPPKQNDPISPRTRIPQT